MQLFSCPLETTEVYEGREKKEESTKREREKKQTHKTPPKKMGGEPCP